LEVAVYTEVEERMLALRMVGEEGRIATGHMVGEYTTVPHTLWQEDCYRAWLEPFLRAVIPRKSGDQQVCCYKVPPLLSLQAMMPRDLKEWERKVM